MYPPTTLSLTHTHSHALGNGPKSFRAPGMVLTKKPYHNKDNPKVFWIDNPQIGSLWQIDSQRIVLVVALKRIYIYTLGGGGSPRGGRGGV